MDTTLSYTVGRSDVTASEEIKLIAYPLFVQGVKNPEDMAVTQRGFAPPCRYGSIEPDPDNPRQSYLDYIESFPLNAEPEVREEPYGKRERGRGGYIRSVSHDS